MISRTTDLLSFVTFTLAPKSISPQSKLLHCSLAIHKFRLHFCSQPLPGVKPDSNSAFVRTVDISLQAQSVLHIFAGIGWHAFGDTHCTTKFPSASRQTEVDAMLVELFSYDITPNVEYPDAHLLHDIAPSSENSSRPHCIGAVLPGQ